eukprot:m.524593 g.524593  ORF g.524593 m.524593 type:complete len:229 (+) comp57531_c2_seq1:558-1244(+)
MHRADLSLHVRRAHVRQRHLRTVSNGQPPQQQTKGAENGGESRAKGNRENRAEADSFLPAPKHNNDSPTAKPKGAKQPSRPFLLDLALSEQHLLVNDGVELDQVELLLPANALCCVVEASAGCADEAHKNGLGLGHSEHRCVLVLGDWLQQADLCAAGGCCWWLAARAGAPMKFERSRCCRDTTRPAGVSLLPPAAQLQPACAPAPHTPSPTAPWRHPLALVHRRDRR